MRIYKVTMHCGQHENYYVHANCVASAVRFAVERDDKLLAEAGDTADYYRRATAVDEFCGADQFVGPPVSFVKKRAA